MVHTFSLVHDGHTFIIPTNHSEDLISLILHTWSMDTVEKQYWFYLLPVMTDANLNRLYNILHTECVKLSQLEEWYEDEIRAMRSVVVQTHNQYDAPSTMPLILPSWHRKMDVIENTEPRERV